MHVEAQTVTAPTSARQLKVRVCTPFDIVRYCRRYEALLGFEAPLGYLARHRARGLFDNGKLVGGYVLNQEAPFRYLSLMPEEARGEFDLPLEDLVEIGCVWMEPRLSLEPRLALYSAIARELGAMGKTHILGGSVGETAMRQQTLALPNPVFRGPARFGDLTLPLWLYSGSLENLYAAFEARGYPLRSTVA